MAAVLNNRHPQIEPTRPLYAQDLVLLSPKKQNQYLLCRRCNRVFKDAFTQRRHFFCWPQTDKQKIERKNLVSKMLLEKFSTTEIKD